MTARAWSIAQAWTAAVEVTATSYGLDPDLIRAESKGRGPRPPEQVREPKKVALFLAVALSDCEYAALGRHVSMHRDTIASHCDDIRDGCAGDPVMEERVDALMIIASGRLSAPRSDAGRSRDDATVYALLIALHARFDRLERRLAAQVLHPTLSDEQGLHPTAPPDHENVIVMRTAP